MNILVLAGGLSPERDVSLSSGSKIASALIERGHRVAMVDVYMDLGELPRFSDEPIPPCSAAETEPDLDALRAERIALRGSEEGSGELIGRGVVDACRAADVVFLALHGGMGENGQLQALLDCYGIVYTGSPYAGCAVAMDKDISKRIVCREGIDTARWITMDRGELSAARVLDELGLPCVVKPIGCGSSVGVSLVRTESELGAALDEAERCGQAGIAEEFVGGRELSVGVLGERALPSIEIEPRGGFYDYKNKYQAGCTVETTPANIPPQLEQRLREASLTAHRALGLYAYSRSDFIYREQDDRLVYLETNTLPGMTPTSLLPQEAAAVGIGYPELCETVVRYALER